MSKPESNIKDYIQNEFVDPIQEEEGDIDADQIPGTGDTTRPDTSERKVKQEIIEHDTVFQEKPFQLENYKSLNFDDLSTLAKKHPTYADGEKQAEPLKTLGRALTYHAAGNFKLAFDTCHKYAAEYDFLNLLMYSLYLKEGYKDEAGKVVDKNLETAVNHLQTLIMLEEDFKRYFNTEEELLRLEKTILEYQLLEIQELKEDQEKYQALLAISNEFIKTSLVALDKKDAHGVLKYCGLATFCCETALKYSGPKKTGTEKDEVAAQLRDVASIKQELRNLSKDRPSKEESSAPDKNLDEPSDLPILPAYGQLVRTSSKKLLDLATAPQFSSLSPSDTLKPARRISVANKLALRQHMISKLTTQTTEIIEGLRAKYGVQTKNMRTEAIRQFAGLALK